MACAASGLNVCPQAVSAFDRLVGVPVERGVDGIAELGTLRHGWAHGHDAREITREREADQTHELTQRNAGAVVRGVAARSIADGAETALEIADQIAVLFRA